MQEGDVVLHTLLAAATAAFTVFIAAGAAAQQPTSQIEPGRHCFGSQSAIQENLPFGADSSETDIVRIEIVFVKAQHASAGWLYTTRNGNHFIQVGSPALLADALRDVSAGNLASGVAKSAESTYFPISAAFAKRLSRNAGAIGLYSCKGTGQ